MLKKYLKERVPDIHELQVKYKLGFLGTALLAPKAWRFNRKNVARGLALGLFIGCTPLPGHMIIATCLALLWPANLPIAVLATWITNPITLAPISYVEYLLGTHLLGWPRMTFSMDEHIQWKWQWFAQTLAEIWEPVMLGSLVVGAILSVSAYWLVLLAWRISVTLKWRTRKPTNES